MREFAARQIGFFKGRGGWNRDEMQAGVRRLAGKQADRLAAGINVGGNLSTS